MNNVPQRVLVLVGAALMIAGSTMTWISVDVGFAEFSSKGTELTEGKITLIAGIVLAVVGIIMIGSGLLGWMSSIAGLVAAAVGSIALLLEYLDVRRRIAESDPDTATATVGLGIWVTALGAIAALVGTVWSMVAQRRATATSSNESRATPEG